MPQLADGAAGSLAANLLASQQARGYVDPMLELGRTACESWVLPPMPQRKAARKKWKRRREEAAQSDRLRAWEAYVSDPKHRCTPAIGHGHAPYPFGVQGRGAGVALHDGA